MVVVMRMEGGEETSCEQGKPHRDRIILVNDKHHEDTGTAGGEASVCKWASSEERTFELRPQSHLKLREQNGGDKAGGGEMVGHPLQVCVAWSLNTWGL